MIEIKYCSDCRWHCRPPTVSAESMLDSKCMHPAVKGLAAEQYSVGAALISPDVQILPRCSLSRGKTRICVEGGKYFEMPRRRALFRKLFQ